jgi:hypothetical protein
VGQDGGTLIGQDKTVTRALEQRLPDILLQRSQSASHRRLALASCAGGSGERAFPRYGEEDAEVAPLHRVS